MSQCSRILKALQDGETVTPYSAFELCGTLALHSRIAELRGLGHHIDCHIVSDGDKRWGEYRLIGQLSLAA